MGTQAIDIMKRFPFFVLAFMVVMATANAQVFPSGNVMVRSGLSTVPHLTLAAGSTGVMTLSGTVDYGDLTGVPTLTGTSLVSGLTLAPFGDSRFGLILTGSLDYNQLVNLPSLITSATSNSATHLSLFRNGSAIALTGSVDYFDLTNRPLITGTSTVPHLRLTLTGTGGAVLSGTVDYNDLTGLPNLTGTSTVPHLTLAQTGSNGMQLSGAVDWDDLTNRPVVILSGSSRVPGLALSGTGSVLLLTGTNLVSGTSTSLGLLLSSDTNGLLTLSGTPTFTGTSSVDGLSLNLTGNSILLSGTPTISGTSGVPGITLSATGSRITLSGTGYASVADGLLAESAVQSGTSEAPGLTLVKSGNVLVLSGTSDIPLASGTQPGLVQFHGDGTKVLYDDGTTAEPPGATGGEANTASNLGGGEGVYASKSGVDLRFKSLVSGSNITLASSGTEITISSTASGGANWVSVPTSGTAAGTLHDMAVSSPYLYVCTGSNSWLRFTGITSFGNMTLTYSSIGDTHGAVYTLVNAGKTVNALRSTDLVGTGADLINRALEYTTTDNNSGEWFAVDLGVGTTLVLSKYTLAMETSHTTQSPRNWKIQGSNSVTWSTGGVAAATWTDLDVRTSDATVASPNWNGVFTVNGGVTTAYRYIRFLNTGANLAGSNFIQVSEVEFYGNISF